MRVSIVATSLDGQQPEPKSVINMVHRIQNRNPGYSDFSNNVSNQSFSFSNQNNSIMTNGANALKFEEEVKLKLKVKRHPQQILLRKLQVQQLLRRKLTQLKIKYLKFLNNRLKHKKLNPSPSNGLENFNFDEETPELFNSDGETEDQTSLTPEIK